VDDLLTVFFNSLQVRTIAGLILIDIGLGIACALRNGQFSARQIANFYRTMIVPYLLGYLVLFVAVNYIIPPGSGLEWLNVGLVGTGWLAIVGALGASIKTNVEFLYRPASTEAG